MGDRWLGTLPTQLSSMCISQHCLPHVIPQALGDEGHSGKMQKEEVQQQSHLFHTQKVNAELQIQAQLTYTVTTGELVRPGQVRSLDHGSPRNPQQLSQFPGHDVFNSGRGASFFSSPQYPRLEACQQRRICVEIGSSSQFPVCSCSPELLLVLPWPNTKYTEATATHNLLNQLLQLDEVKS